VRVTNIGRQAMGLPLAELTDKGQAKAGAHFLRWRRNPASMPASARDGHIEPDVCHQKQGTKSDTVKRREARRRKLTR
jgi:hypothetical protein